MKVLFAVNNEKIVQSIVKTYQKMYKDVLAYKTVYYFNALVKELARDKSFDRIIISEDLEPFSNNNYDAIDRFIFDKLDSVSDEAEDDNGNDIPIILICSDRREKGNPLLAKLFGIGVYSGMLGEDRSIDEVCNLINKPRGKKEAKTYYAIEVDDVKYATENEDNVSEAEIQNILAHYKKLGKNEDKYLESFDNIASQYNDEQLKIIIKFLPLHVKAVLEQRSEKYKDVIVFSGRRSKVKTKDVREMSDQFTEDNTGIDVLDSAKLKSGLSKPVIIPGVSTGARQVKKRNDEERPVNEIRKPVQPIEDVILDEEEEEIAKEPLSSAVMQSAPSIIPSLEEFDDSKAELYEKPDIRSTEKQVDLFGLDDEDDNNESTTLEQNSYRNDMILDIDKIDEDKKEDDIDDIFAVEPTMEPVKRGRGRPRKTPVVAVDMQNAVKRGRGRPKKIQSIYEAEENITELEQDNSFESIVSDALNESDTIESDTGTVDLFDLDSNETEIQPIKQENKEPIRPIARTDLQTTESEIDIFGMDDNSEEVKEVENDFLNAAQTPNPIVQKPNFVPSQSNMPQANVEGTPFTMGEDVISSILAKNKKIVSFVGTSKNGTSFLVNNLAALLSSMGIKTAILDMTTNKDDYYIYTKNQENLRQLATESMEGLRRGIDKGIVVNKYLSVFTTVPGQPDVVYDNEKIIDTLTSNYSLILVDCDFNTPLEYFALAQEIYLIQSMDILTIQPFTAFLRELKTRKLLQNNLRVVINKYINTRSLTAKSIIGGLAFYNDPAMTFMTELFDRNKTIYFTIPFEVQNYARYIEGLVDCNISTGGYTKNFTKSLKELAEAVYPLVDDGKGKNRMANPGANFSYDMNATLEQMKKNY